MLRAGDLNHRLRIEQPTYTQNQTTGDMVVTWVAVATVWGKIRPASAREFISAAAEQSKVVGRITIRARAGIDATMRVVHISTGRLYNIEGVLPDPDSGEEYLTLPVSEGVRTDDADSSSTDVVRNVIDTLRNVID